MSKYVWRDITDIRTALSKSQPWPHDIWAGHLIRLMHKVYLQSVCVLQWTSFVQVDSAVDFLQKWQFAILVKFSSMQFNCCLMMKPNSRTNFYIISASSMGFIFDWQRMKESWQRGRILDRRKYLCSEWKWVCIAGQWGGYQLYWLEWAIAAYKGWALPIPKPIHPGGLAHTHTYHHHHH